MEASVLPETNKGEKAVKNMKWTKGILGLATMVAVFYMSALTCLAAEGKVTADTAKIRASASTDSEVVGSTVQGKVIDIFGSVKDSAGNTWYKVAVAGNSFGYIRSDLVSTSDTIKEIDGGTATTQQPAATTDAPKPEATVPTSIGEQAATIKSDSSVRIRAGASTQHDAVSSLPNGTAITLIGEANDSAGNKWYQMTCTYNGKTIEGYVRSDLITIGSEGAAEAPAAEGTTEGEATEGENAEGTLLEEGTGEVPPEEGVEPEAPAEEAEPENKDYEIVYTQNEAGEYEYYFYDNINGTRQKLSDLLNVVDVANQTSQKLVEQKEQDKMIIIILAVVIVLLFIVITVMIFKIRDLYYADYDEEDEEEEEEEEPLPVKRKVRRREEDFDDEPPVPVRKKRPVAPSEPPRPAAQPKQHATPHVREKQETAPKPATRKPQNFLVDDDEFEFEFLNMDDKDL